MPITAVLGPTNTGKTHLAIERMCGHSSGIIGLPLRLLAREVYDRIVSIKGVKEAGLITGEEKIMPPGARWIACTVESMPVDHDAAFLAIDEAQLAADPERGHVFTDRTLCARGREETMILGSDTIAPLIRKLVPDAEINRRPRFSTLSYAGAKKLSRLPKRSAIVAFSAEEVYAVAEMLRRARGGAAVVMGALSPRTRNAQVAMFEAGEVDYLVATDAIGMGLNMDLDHVAFASLSKFDGRRQRRLTTPEMAQIAGRAGRHQRDGTFGSIGGALFDPREIEAIEEHRFPRLDWVYWRDGAPDLSTVDALIDSLETVPDRDGLRAAPEASDLAVLKTLSTDSDIGARGQVGRLWEACGLPDFRQVGAEHHARLVGRLFEYLTGGDGHIPADWFANQLARLDQVSGDVGTLGGRIADARTWAYIAHRADWLADPAHWVGRTEVLEERLSDALHKRLTERFVDRRTAVLMRDIGNDPALLDVTVDAEGAVSVDGETIGRIDGFAFHVDPAARHGDRKRLLAAAERRLPKERARRAKALVESADSAFTLSQSGILWGGHEVAQLLPGRVVRSPRVRPDDALHVLAPADGDAVKARIERWLIAQIALHLAPLTDMAAAATDPRTPAPVRALLASLAAAGGSIARTEIESVVDALDAKHRAVLRRAGLTIGALDLFDARLLKPAPTHWIAALRGDRAPQPPPGVTVFDRDAPGFRRFGPQTVRIDVAERLIRALHRRRDEAGFSPDVALATSIGLKPESFAALLRATGFRVDVEGRWRWRARARSRASVSPTNPAFAALEDWRVNG